MKHLTDKKINIAAFRYSAILTSALILILGLNLLVAIKFGYDVRNLEWWLISPALTIFICYVAARLSRK